MTDDVVKITVSLHKSQYDMLEKISNITDVSKADVLRKAIVNEYFWRENIKEGYLPALIDKNGKPKAVIFR